MAGRLPHCGILIIGLQMALSIMDASASVTHSNAIDMNKRNDLSTNPSSHSYNTRNEIETIINQRDDINALRRLGSRKDER